MIYTVRMKSGVRLALAVLGLTAAAVSAQTQQPLVVRGQSQVLRLYGAKTGTPVVVTSGDGGFVHLAPAVAEFGDSVVRMGADGGLTRSPKYSESDKPACAVVLSPFVETLSGHRLMG